MKITMEESHFWQYFDEKYLRYSIALTAIFASVYLLIFLLGLVGNLLVIFVIFLKPAMRNATNLLIFNLAVADLFVIVFCVLPTFVANAIIPWIMGPTMCKVIAYVQGVSVCASSYSLVVISLNRCKAINSPLERPPGLSKTHAWISIIFIWLLSLILTFPWLYTFDIIPTTSQDEFTYCLEKWENEEHGKFYFLFAHFIFCYSIPFVLIAVSNMAVWFHVKKREVPQETATVGQIKDLHKKTKLGVQKMLTSVTVIFLLCWMPLYIIGIVVKFSSFSKMERYNHNNNHNNNDEDGNDYLVSVVTLVAQLLAYSNSCINPILYSFMSSRFKQCFKSFLPNWLNFGNKKEKIIWGKGDGQRLVRIGRDEIDNKLRKDKVRRFECDRNKILSKTVIVNDDNGVEKFMMSSITLEKVTTQVVQTNLLASSNSLNNITSF